MVFHIKQYVRPNNENQPKNPHQRCHRWQPLDSVQQCSNANRRTDHRRAANTGPNDCADNRRADQCTANRYPARANQRPHCPSSNTNSGGNGDLGSGADAEW